MLNASKRESIKKLVELKLQEGSGGFRFMALISSLIEERIIQESDIGVELMDQFTEILTCIYQMGYSIYEYNDFKSTDKLSKLKYFISAHGKLWHP